MQTHSWRTVGRNDLEMKQRIYKEAWKTSKCVYSKEPNNMQTNINYRVTMVRFKSQAAKGLVFLLKIVGDLSPQECKYDENLPKALVSSYTRSNDGKSARDLQ